MKENGFRREVKSIGDVVDDVIARLKPGEIDARWAIAEAWRSISDERMLRWSRVGTYRSGVVTIEVTSPPLCSQLAGFRAQRLLLRLREAVGETAIVRELRFVHAEN